MGEKELQEKRLDARGRAESAIESYYSACREADYEFSEDICDVVFDATTGEVRLEVSD